MKKNFLFAVVVVVLLTILSACAGQRYAVVLWSPDETEVATSSVLRVIQESQYSDTCILELADQTAVELPKARVQFFDDRASAEAFVAAMADYTDAFAHVTRDGLPVREETDNTAQSVYRLREGETVKILARSADQATFSDMTDYWYEVMASDGTRGWCFGYSLDLYTLSGGGNIASYRNTGPDASLAGILATVWRPNYYLLMRQTGHYDLSLFTPDNFLVMDEYSSRLRIVEPDFSGEFAYTAITPVATGFYRLEGADIEIRINPAGNINVRFNKNGRFVQEDFVRLDAEVETIIDLELTRRAMRLASLGSALDSVSSRSYGVLRVKPDGGFLWTGYRPLVPSLIPASESGEGTVSFDRYLSEELTPDFDGMATLSFSGGTVLHFAYQIEGSTVRLTYVPSAGFQGNTVTSIGGSPLVLVFSAEG